MYENANTAYFRLTWTSNGWVKVKAHHNLLMPRIVFPKARMSEANPEGTNEVLRETYRRFGML